MFRTTLLETRCVGCGEDCDADYLTRMRLCPECAADDALALDHTSSCSCPPCGRYQRRTEAMRAAGLDVVRA